jgi:hypothetical protein
LFCILVALLSCFTVPVGPGQAIYLLPYPWLWMATFLANYLNCLYNQTPQSHSYNFTVNV